MATFHDRATSATPTQHRVLGDSRRSSSSADDESADGSWHDAVSATTSRHAGPSSSGTLASLSAKSASLAPSNITQGSFNSDLKHASISRNATPRPPESITHGRGNGVGGDNEAPTTEQRQAIIRGQIEKEIKIKTGTENMLEALLAKNMKQTKEQRLRVESELSSSHRKIAQLQNELEEELMRAQLTPIEAPEARRLSTFFNATSGRSPSRATTHATGESFEDEDSEAESPTVVLSETLQELEAEGMSPDYYVDRANNLVDLFKRYPTLKYDLEWSVFGLRVQVMLLSESRDVVAAGYRLTRYAIADRKSIQVIRALHTDELVMLSLVKESKASMEREQALKFVRAFLDVKDGVRELSRSVVRTLVSIAEHRDDRLRNICIMTIAELLVKDPALLFSAGGIGTLNDVLGEGTFGASDSLAAGFVHVLDSPKSRKYLRAGCELNSVFANFTETVPDSDRHLKLKYSAKAISAMLKTWPGILTLAQNPERPLQSLLLSLQFPDPQSRDLILELLFDALRIKPPSWSSSFLAGRRLTTYGRVANMKSDQEKKQPRAVYEDEDNSFDLTAHFSGLILALLVEAGLIKVLSDLIEDEPDLSLKRKTTLLLAEVLRRAQRCLPSSMCSNLHLLPSLLPSSSALKERSDNQHLSTSTIYQMESISRTMTRSDDISDVNGRYSVSAEIPASLFTGEQNKSKLSATMDEAQFRTAILDTNVLSSVNFMKWKWDLILNIIEGPLTNPKRLDEAIKGSKFMKRLPNRRYVRTGCALMRCLVQSPEGSKYLAQNKLLRQIAECLAQVDRMSGLTSLSPLFSREQMADTLSGGYFALLGTLSSEPNGLQMMERWHMLNMFYHIVELTDRNDLIQTLLGNMDFTRESHLRVILSKALTTGSKDIRIFSTKLLRKYVVGKVLQGTPVEWVIQLLVTQLYDPDVAVCQVAVKILEEACNQRDYLEYVVKCRPSLDHLGEIGAPLLLRFLSTSVGYHYLDGLDYITQEMDDWFLGRNDAYVGLVEASLSRAYVDQPRRNSLALNDIVEMQDIGLVPPHFYRELARTTEGCKLLEQSGHFYEFASILRDFQLNEEDPEVLLKVKGSLWAIGNVGSMELSAPFLEETDIVERIVQIAENAAVMTMRGTAFFVLGLVSRSQHGLEMLIEAGWDAAVDQRGRSLGSCMPMDLRKLYSVTFEQHHARTEKDKAARNRYKAASKDQDPLKQKVLSLIIDMGNTVLAKKAASDLQVFKANRPDCFRRIDLFEKTLVILESHHFRLSARRFALELFDKSVLRRIIFGDDSGSESDSAMSE
ncbi:sterility protein Ste20 [Arthroderma uncinatum]|uniref:sterility protein Ste20 n=1 Tax=Arthroderma uncinatum TaxID=74035 RepID=UPI00144AC352|nr:sterility protein Ste20 [Arthroderma uncinatum]KAF3491087.1 sterility protein Ste20 [Arthroderma uncinatum]